MTDVGRFIKRSRRSRGMRQLELAELLDTSQAFISMVENGKAVPTQEQLTRMVEVLQMKPLVKPLIELERTSTVARLRSVAAEILELADSLESARLPMSRNEP